MNTDPYYDKESINELVQLFEKLRSGASSVFLEEEAFEKIIDYYDDQENASRAMEAVNIGIEYFPFSSSLLFKKADLLLASRKYNEALAILEKAELLDANDLNLYILKTDAYLALDKQEKAVSLLEEAITHFEGEEKIELLFELADVYFFSLI